jgi:hypothetical protein
MNEAEAPLTRAECLAAIKRFVGLGFQYALLPVLSTSSTNNLWHSKAEIEQLGDIYNVAVRPGQAPDGRFISSFGIRVEDDYNFQVPLRDMPVYNFLRDFGTLQFEAGSVATFVFKSDRLIEINEHTDCRERIFPERLHGAQLVTSRGWLGWGVCNDSRGRSCRIACTGEPLDIRRLPLLMDSLRATGRFRASVSDAYIGDITGPPLL